MRSSGTEWPYAELRSLSSQNAVESLIQASALVDLPTGALDGRHGRYDLFGTGKRTEYEIILRDSSISAISRDSGEMYSVTNDDVRILKVDQVRLSEHLADANGFDTNTSLLKSPSGFLRIGSLPLTSRKIDWFLCLDESCLEDDGALAIFQEYSRSNSALVVVSLSDPASAPERWRQSTSLALTSLPSHTNDWILNRKAFLSPKYGFRARDVAAQLYEYSGVILLVDQDEQTVFINGTDLGFSSDIRPYRYVAALSECAGSPIQLDDFARFNLNYIHESSKRQQMARQDLTDVRKNINQHIVDPVSRAAAIDLFKNRKYGMVILPLRREEILHWSRERNG